MSTWDEQYYILMQSDNVGIPDLVGTQKTKTRNYQTSKFTLDTEPLSFVNGDQEEFEEEGIREILPPILFASPNIVVQDGVKDHLSLLNMKNVNFFPAIYIDGNDEWHEDFWFLHTDSKLICWDKNLSSVRQFDKTLPPRVDKYVLSQEILEDIPEENRLIFIMGGTDLRELFVHQKIIDYFEEAMVTGWRAFKVSEYEFGMEFN